MGRSGAEIQAECLQALRDGKGKCLTQDGARLDEDFDVGEPGYKKALIEAYTYGIMHADAPLTTEGLRVIHQIATQSVGKMRIDTQFDHTFSEGEGTRAFSLISKRTITPEGREEIIQNFEDQVRDVLEQGVTSAQDTETLLAAIKTDEAARLQVARALNIDYYYRFNAEDVDAGKESGVIIALNATPEKRAKEILERYEASRQEISLPSTPVQALSSPDASSPTTPTSTSGLLGGGLGALGGGLFSTGFMFDIFKQTDREKEKIGHIVDMITALERLHPFSDGNCRTLCVVLLNKELVRNGLRPTILTDPNAFDGHSREELINEILAGQTRYDSVVKARSEEKVSLEFEYPDGAQKTVQLATTNTKDAELAIQAIDKYRSEAHDIISQPRLR